jgi:hypothetical protein
MNAKERLETVEDLKGLLKIFNEGKHWDGRSWTYQLVGPHRYIPYLGGIEKAIKLLDDSDDEL